jgi:hypothetical protein
MPEVYASCSDGVEVAQPGSVSCRWIWVVPATDQDRRASSSASTITVTDEMVVKRYAPGDFAAELLKAQLLHDTSIDAEFIAPAVLDVDESQHTIGYQRLDCSHSLLDLLADGRRSLASIRSVFARVGASLAAIHAIEAPGDRTVIEERSDLFVAALARRTTPVDSSEWLVLQHGDFGFTNVFVDPDDRITVIDPSPNGYTSIHPLNLDAPELDIAVLCSHLVGRVASVRALARASRYGRDLVDEVLDGYQPAGATIDRARLRLFTLASVDAVVAHRSPGSRTHRRAVLRPLAALLARNV